MKSSFERCSITLKNVLGGDVCQMLFKASLSVPLSDLRTPLRPTKCIAFILPTKTRTIGEKNVQGIGQQTASQGVISHRHFKGKNFNKQEVYRFLRKKVGSL